MWFLNLKVLINSSFINHLGVQCFFPACLSGYFVVMTLPDECSFIRNEETSPIKVFRKVVEWRLQSESLLETLLFAKSELLLSRQNGNTDPTLKGFSLHLTSENICRKRIKIIKSGYLPQDCDCSSDREVSRIYSPGLSLRSQVSGTVFISLLVPDFKNQVLELYSKLCIQMK